ncbi:MAG: deoxyribonuclease, partial [Planctomycetota bacterium]
VAVKGLAELGQIPGMGSLGGDAPTNVRRTKVYDHILIDRLTTQEFTGRAGVLDLQQLLGVDEATERSISDHLPVWAEFYPYEAPPSRSSRP